MEFFSLLIKIVVNRRDIIAVFEKTCNLLRERSGGMSVDKKELIGKIEALAPLSGQEAWDNSGWQISLGGAEVSKILIALEITGDVIEEAAAGAADLILIHHPLIFSTAMKSIDSENLRGGYVVSLIQKGISVYAAHTSFDSAEGGMNDGLAKILGLTSLRPFPSPKASEDGPAQGDDSASRVGFAGAMGRRGTLPAPKPFSEICRLIKTALDPDFPIKAAGDPDKTISSVAICGGGAGDLLEAAIKEDVDLFITGDVRHHQGQWAKESGVCLIDGGHWGTEKHFTDMMYEFLSKEFAGRLILDKSTLDLNPFDMV